MRLEESGLDFSLWNIGVTSEAGCYDDQGIHFLPI
jgi:hypothetical protein